MTLNIGKVLHHPVLPDVIPMKRLLKLTPLHFQVRAIAFFPDLHLSKLADIRHKLREIIVMRTLIAARISQVE